jgi:hypothetical protein
MTDFPQRQRNKKLAADDADDADMKTELTFVAFIFLIRAHLR